MGIASLRIVESGLRIRPLSECEDPDADVERERAPASSSVGALVLLVVHGAASGRRGSGRARHLDLLHLLLLQPLVDEVAMMLAAQRGEAGTERDKVVGSQDGRDEIVGLGAVGFGVGLEIGRVGRFGQRDEALAVRAEVFEELLDDGVHARQALWAREE
ncbi:hypothetical protein L1887_56500 [Cichorium endivia]|nr:hypothetical protein L1887_56500 [Cichorium endivia]